MIANRESTAETMLRALATSIGALDAAADLDVDRSDADRQFFASERDALQTRFDAVDKAETEATSHALRITMKRQARVVVGDAVLDRGVSKSKARMKVELKGTQDADGADHVFGADVSEIINAERSKEPALVLAAVEKFGDVQAFTGKTEMAADLTARAKKQQQNFKDREDAAVIAAKLDGALTRSIEHGADALYGLEKRLLDRFTREVRYVKAFFLDVAPSKPKKDAKEEGKDPAAKPDPAAPKADAKPDGAAPAAPKAEAKPDGATGLAPKGDAKNDAE